MIQIIYGRKGCGKSKRLVDMANEELANAKGDIVFIDDDSRAMYDLRHEIRFVNCCDYGIDNTDKLYGFISGMMAQDYDISSIYIDSIKNVFEKSKEEKQQEFFANLEKIAQQNDIRVLMVLSGNDEQLPEFLKKYIV